MNLDQLSSNTFLEKRWFTKSGFITALIFTNGFLATLLLSTERISISESISTLIVVSIFLFLIWKISLRTPKTQKGRVGFIISLYCEEDAEDRKLKSDFIIPLRQLLGSSNKEAKFDIIEYPQHIARTVNTQRDAEKLRIKSRAQFMLYGRVRETVLDGKDIHVIELNGIVGHEVVAHEVQTKFAKEFTELLPQNFNIQKENDLLSFKLTSEWIGVVSEYIIGIASFISGNHDYAEELYRSALGHLQGFDKDFEIYLKLSKRLPIRISEVYEKRASLIHQSWSETKEARYIEELGINLKQIPEDRRKMERVIFLTAIHIFLSERDTKSALKTLNKMKSVANGRANSDVIGCWHYNTAFLYAYEGNLVKAIRHYRLAAKAVVVQDIVNQVEDFMCWLIEISPDKYQLYYCLGFFNWKSKGDLLRAEKDLTLFIDKCREGEFTKEKELARSWIKEMHSITKMPPSSPIT